MARSDGFNQTSVAATQNVSIPDELRRALEKLPEQDRPPIIIAFQRQIEAFSGPFPPPWMLEEYERHHPGFLTELLKRASAAQLHEEELDRHMLSAQVRYMTRGQVMAYTLSLFCFAVAGFAIYFVQPWVAGLFGVAALTPVIAQFLKNPYTHQRIKAADNKPQR